MIYIYYYTGLLSFSYRLQWIDMFMFISCFFFIFMILSCSWNVFGKSDRIGVNSANSLFSCFASKIPVPPVLSAVNYGRVGVSERGNGTCCCSAMQSMQCNAMQLYFAQEQSTRWEANTKPVSDKGDSQIYLRGHFSKSTPTCNNQQKTHTFWGGDYFSAIEYR